MQLLFVIIAALSPVAIALYYIFQKDKNQPEPAKWLIKAFVFGIISAFLSFVFSIPLSIAWGMNVNIAVYDNFLIAFSDAFLLAAIPEEIAKLIMLWWLLKKNPFFDEKFDGIVYAVCIGMGFAGLENILYLMNGLEDGSWISIGISRALFSIPGHFFFAVLMGYYLSIYHFGIDQSKKTKAMILVAPIVAHGLFDGIIMSMQINEGLALFFMILFIIFFNQIKKIGKERINNLLNK